MRTSNLSRSVRLALWADQVGRGRAAGADAVRAVTLDDEPHTVVGLEGRPDGATLEDLLAALSLPGTTLAAALPAPGDVAGVPASIATDATEAGEALLVEAGDARGAPHGGGATGGGTRPAWAVVPEVVEFGSDLEPGHLVTWHVREVEPWSARFLAAVGSPADAERELRVALLTATEALDRLDVARWREDAADGIAALRDDGGPAWLPPRLAPRRARTLTLAVRLRRIVELGSVDEGGAVNLWQADQRGAALQSVEQTSRRALSAVTANIVPDAAAD
ncbi:hypothetical protein [Paraoerskovia sediminicola]|nr:hypothetical protein [Paraoerskovia sediminicola]